MKWDRIALFVIDAAFALAEHLVGWSDRRKAKKKPTPPPLVRGMSVKDLMEIKAQGDEKAKRAREAASQAPTVVIPPPSEWTKRGGGGSRY